GGDATDRGRGDAVDGHADLGEHGSGGEVEDRVGARLGERLAEVVLEVLALAQTHRSAPAGAAGARRVQHATPDLVADPVGVLAAVPDAIDHDDAGLAGVGLTGLRGRFGGGRG